jgi:PLP dependent protein
MNPLIKETVERLKGATLIAVTKRQPVERINDAINSGAKIIGESKIQEIESKILHLLPCKIHMIGHLQTNKVKKAVEIFDMIQSVDSLRLAKEINKRAANIEKVQDILIQINIGKEEQKTGFLAKNCEKSFIEISQYPNIKVKGLMCVHPYFSDKEKVRPYFKKMNTLFEKMKKKFNIEILSMGMSSDYDIAIEEGATMVRIGTRLFREQK